MKKQNKLMALLEKGAKYVDSHQREIMLGGAIAGTVVTAVLSWRAGIKADKILTEQRAKMDALEADFEADDIIRMTEEEYKTKKKELTIETVKKMAPVVAPPVIAGAGTIISVVGGYKCASNQIATLSALYSMSEKALAEHIEKTELIAGPKKAQEVEEAVNKEKVKANPPSESNTIINTGRGDCLFLDEVSGRYFYSRPDDVKRAVNVINNEINSEGYFLPLNEFYNELGIPTTTMGKDLGFPAGKLIDFDNIFTVILNDDDTVVYILHYDVEPGHGWFYDR